ncbi:MAG: hypothetical protein Fur0046_01480 [Cyanobacteria bacterium J069]|nr:MAG: DUF4332 domain-containing protein [Cyanobacteria bacterium J069]
MPSQPGQTLPQPIRSCNWAIAQLPGLSEKHLDLLSKANIQTTLDLWRRTQTPAQRHNLAAQLQLHPKHVNKWAALSDLARIPAVGCTYCGLLLHAGIISVPQLAEVALPNLHRHLMRLQVATMQRQDLCPPLGEVSLWVQQARQLNQTKR